MKEGLPGPEVLQAKLAVPTVACGGAEGEGELGSGSEINGI